MAVIDNPCDVGNYDIKLIKNGRNLKLGGARIQRIEYGRILDEVSNATVNLITAGSDGDDCCGQLGMVDHWNTDLLITYKDPGATEEVVKWRGPVITVDDGDGDMVIQASDVLMWSTRRTVDVDVTYTDQDVSDIAQALWLQFVASIDPPVYEIVKYESGVRESRMVPADGRRKVWNVIEEMLDTGLDITTVGSKILIGVAPFDVLKLTDEQVAGEVRIVKDGKEFANYVTVNASKDIVGVYPPGLKEGSFGYPLVEEVISDSGLQDAQTAQNAAKARYDFSARGVRRVRAAGGLQLLPNSNIIGRDLVAGQLITFSASKSCYSATETLRLGSVTISVEGGVETAIINLQPVGGVQGLASI